MRRGIRNIVSVTVEDMDLTACSNIKLFVRQFGTEYEYTGTVSSSDTAKVTFTIPKIDAVKFRAGLSEIQVALTDSDGVPRSHDPIKIKMGDLLKEEGYGS